MFRPMDEVPLDGTPVLVLLPEGEDVLGNRLVAATYKMTANKHIMGFVGGKMGYDVATPIGWILESEVIGKIS